MSNYLLRAFAIAAIAIGFMSGASADDRDSPLDTGEFAWTSSGPLVEPAQRDDDPCHALKDPTIVFAEGKWHLFCTIRSQKRTHQIEYLSFVDWKEANAAERHVLKIVDGYFCAPQVFFFTPHKKWYLIFQTSDPKKQQLRPAYATTETISDPDSWSPPRLMIDHQPRATSRWIDFWVICDESKAHLFFTSLDGKMWRGETPLAEFPLGWNEPQMVLQGDIFEASHTYKLKDQERYLTVVEAQGAGGRRYYKAYTAERLDGEWKPLADTAERPFASPKNVLQPEGEWSNSFSHGELLRTGHDERLEVDPAHLQFLFQGVRDAERAGKAYGQIPWRLGLLTLKRS